MFEEKIFSWFISLLIFEKQIIDYNLSFCFLWTGQACLEFCKISSFLPSKVFFETKGQKERWKGIVMVTFDQRSFDPLLVFPFSFILLIYFCPSSPWTWLVPHTHLCFNSFAFSLTVLKKGESTKAEDVKLVWSRLHVCLLQLYELRFVFLSNICLRFYWRAEEEEEKKME